MFEYCQECNEMFEYCQECNEHFERLNNQYAS